MVLAVSCTLLLAQPAWARHRAAVVGLTATPPAFSPNGDGAKDTTTLEVTLDTSATVDLVVNDPGAATVRTLAAAVVAPTGQSDFPWDGRADGGSRVSDGVYTVVVTADDGAGGVTQESTKVTVDTAALEFRWSGVVPEPLRTLGPIRFTFVAHDVSKDLRAVLTVQDASGSEVDSQEYDSLRVGRGSLSWRPRYGSGQPLLQGLYMAKIVLTDDAGNRTVSPLRPFRNLRPGDTRVVHRLGGAGQRVALTFDDCNDGGAWTKILRILHDRNVEASFFCLGSRVAQYPAQARRTVEDGHTIGEHSWNHPLMTGLSYQAILQQMAHTQRAWWKVARITPTPYFRPPDGSYDATTLGAAGDSGYAWTILWDVDPQDWTQPGAGVITDRVVGSSRAGSIVVMHAQDLTAAALPEIISRLRAKGLEPVGLSELFAQTGAHVADYTPRGSEYE